MAFHIHVIGLGVTDKAELSPTALQALQASACVIGAERQLAVVKHLLNTQQSQCLPPLKNLLALLETYREQQQVVTVLASGDPLYYGIGRWFGRHYEAASLSFYPAVSSIQAACHELGLSQQDVTVISLHGRPVEKIRRHLKHGQTLVVLTDQHSTPAVLADECIAAGFDQSTLWVCENLGYPEQCLQKFNVADLAAGQQRFAALHVSVIELAGRGGVYASFAGFNDGSFITDSDAGRGMITKREVRLAVLSLLQPAPKDVAWDIGAGCGGISVEWAYWNEQGQVHAVEHHPERLACLEKNRQRFGVASNLSVLAGRAPECLATMPAANKIFIGGSDGNLAELLALCWQHLPEGGVLVASAVTEDSKMLLQQFYRQRMLDHTAQTETMQLAISRGGELAGQLVYRPNLPVSLFKFLKRSSNSVLSGDQQ